ncbi:MAG: IS200/IS605 family transposase [Odoribacteraceae bacterium]|jgi:REP element-mobilizing transposase RayT|nr:IS200/IS605 family transposase [Odoribacteraceae bacterium]
MATYYQCYTHLIFAVKDRECLIREPIREKIQAYICGIVNQDKCKVISIYCNPDHTHLLVGFRPSISISDLVRDIKSVSSKFINEQKLIYSHFQWQDGFGAFTYSHSQITNVSNYINDQVEHHKKQSFKDEYQRFLEKYEIVYDEQYLFDWLD